MIIGFFTTQAHSGTFLINSDAQKGRKKKKKNHQLSSHCRHQENLYYSSLVLEFTFNLTLKCSLCLTFSLYEVLAFCRSTSFNTFHANFLMLDQDENIDIVKKIKCCIFLYDRRLFYKSKADPCIYGRSLLPLNLKSNAKNANLS